MDGGSAEGVVVGLAEAAQDGRKVQIFFLHFLMMAAALLGLATANELLHCFEDFIGSAHVAVDKVLVVELQKPVVSFVFLQRPMPSVNLFRFF